MGFRRARIRTTLMAVAALVTSGCPGVIGGLTTPKIELTGPGGDVIPSTEGSYTFDQTLVGASREAEIALRNAGTANLVLTGSPLVRISGPDAASFLVVQSPVTPVAPSASTAFRLAFEPAAAGTHVALLTIRSNDDERDPCVVEISGEAVLTPEPDIAVEDPAGDPMASGGGYAFADTATGATRSALFTIRNTGTETLNLTGSPRVQVAGDPQIVLTAQPAQTVAAGGSTTFEITFEPDTAAAFAAQLSIASDDPDQGVYILDVEGEGYVPTPDIGLEGPGSVPVASSGQYTFAVTSVGSSREVVFTVRNTGEVELQLTGAPTVELSGTDAALFAVTDDPATAIPASGSETFRVTFTPTDETPRSAQLTLESNDPDEDPYIIDLSATGAIAPEMDVLQGATPIPDGTGVHTISGTTQVLGWVQVVFTIENNGSDDLSAAAPTISGTHAADFEVTALPTSPVAASGSTTFTVDFVPQEYGLRTATVSILNDDSDENPYTFIIEGEAELNELKVVSTAQASTLPSLVWAGDQYGLLWQDGSPTRPYFARISGLGDASAPVTDITAAGTDVDLAWNADNDEFGLAWAQGGYVYFARRNADGTQALTAIPMSTTATAGYGQSIAWNGTYYGVAWGDTRDGGDPEIYFALVTPSDGSPESEVRITNSTGYSMLPSLVWTGTEFGVAWVDTRDTGGEDEIYFARISSAGVKQGSDVPITGGTAQDAYISSNPSLAWAGTRYGLAWHDERDGNAEIYFTRVSTAGADQNDDLRVTNSAGTSHNASLAWTGTEYGLAWADNRDTQYEIYFTRISSSAAEVGDDVRISVDNTTNSDRPSLASAAGGLYGVAWQDLRDGQNEIYFAILEADGTKK